MAGYIGTKAAVVTPGAERKKVFSITTTTTSLTGLAYTPGFVHVFHNGVRLVDGTDYTATNGTSLTLTTAAQNGDEVVVISYATFEVADAYTKAESDDRYVNVTGDTMTGALAVNGNLTVDTNTLFVDTANNNVGIGTSSPNKSSSNLALTVNAASGQYPAIELSTGDTGRWYINADAVNVYDVAMNNTNRTFSTGGSERMRIDSAGRVTMPYQPSFWAQLVSNYVQGSVSGQLLGTNNGWSISTVHNTGNHYSAATGLFTAPVAGVYVFGINDLYYAGSSYIQSGITINGGASTAYKYTDATGTVYDSAATTITVSLAASDTAGFFVTSNNATSFLHGGGYNNMFGYLIG